MLRVQQFRYMSICCTLAYILISKKGNICEKKDFEIMTVVGEIYTYINRTSIMWELCR